MERIVLAYSGGPRSSAAIPWLLESDAHRSRHDEVVAVTVDLGQRVVLEGVRHRAMASGAELNIHPEDVSKRTRAQATGQTSELQLAEWPA